MTYSYWRTERLIRDAVDRRILTQTRIWDGVFSVLGSADLIALTLVCMIGLLASFAALLAYPSYAEALQTLQLF